MKYTDINKNKIIGFNIKNILRFIINLNIISLNKILLYLKNNIYL